MGRELAQFFDFYLREVLFRASIYGKKKFKFLLALLDPKNQQKSIQYLQSGKKTLNYSSLDPPYFDQFVPSLKMLIFGGKIW